VNITELTDSIRAYSDAIATTTEPSVFCCSKTLAVSTTKTVAGLIRESATLDGTLPVEIVAAPSAGLHKQISNIVIHNLDTVSHTITVEFYNSESSQLIHAVVLLAGEKASYSPDGLWRKYNASGVATSGILKVLGQSNPSATTLTTAYTVPASKSAEINSIMVCNRSATAASFRVAIRPAGASISNEHYVYYDVPIGGNDTFESSLGINLSATDVVSVYANNATLSFNVFGKEH
jgi:hypothetical protein